MEFSIALIANGLIEDNLSLAPSIRKHSKVIAVDGGLAYCRSMGIIPDLIIGDLDSIPEVLLDQFQDVPILRFPSAKDETDTELAILEALTLQPEKIVLFGALGKRIDHTLYNLYLLQRFENVLEIESESECIFPIKSGHPVNTVPGQNLSLIPLFGPVPNVSSQGLKWELKGKTLDQNLMSISNVSLGTDFTVFYNQGCLICCLQKWQPQYSEDARGV